MLPECSGCFTWNNTDGRSAGVRGAVCQQGGAAAVSRGTHRRGGAPGSAWSMPTGRGSRCFTWNTPEGRSAGVCVEHANRPGQSLFYVEHTDGAERRGPRGAADGTAQRGSRVPCRQDSAAGLSLGTDHLAGRGESGGDPETVGLGRQAEVCGFTWNMPTRGTRGVSRGTYNEACRGVSGEIRNIGVGRICRVAHTVKAGQRDFSRSIPTRRSRARWARSENRGVGPGLSAPSGALPPQGGLPVAPAPFSGAIPPQPHGNQFC